MSILWLLAKAISTAPALTTLNMEYNATKEYLSEGCVIDRIASYLHGKNVIGLDGFKEASANLQGIFNLLDTTGFSKDVSFLIKQYLLPTITRKYLTEEERLELELLEHKQTGVKKAISKSPIDTSIASPTSVAAADASSIATAYYYDDHKMLIHKSASSFTSQTSVAAAVDHRAETILRFDADGEEQYESSLPSGLASAASELESSKFTVAEEDNTYVSEMNYALDLVLPWTLLERVLLKYNSTESSDSFDASLLGLELPLGAE